MSYAIIGFGNIGQALAKAFARRGIEVSIFGQIGADSSSCFSSIEQGCARLPLNQRSTRSWRDTTQAGFRSTRASVGDELRHAACCR